MAGAAGTTIPAGTGTGALGFSLNLAAASATDAAIGGGETGVSTGDGRTGGIIPIGGSVSGGGSTGDAATAAEEVGAPPEGAVGAAGMDVASAGANVACGGGGLAARRGFNRTRSSADAISPGFSPEAGAEGDATGGVAGMAGMGAVAGAG